MCGIAGILNTRDHNKVEKDLLLKMISLIRHRGPDESAGVLHGLFAAGLVAALYAGNRGDWWLLALFIAKITWEQTVGSMPGSAEIAGGNVIVDAHLYGAIGGTVAVLSIILTKKRRRPRTP